MPEKIPPGFCWSQVGGTLVGGRGLAVSAQPPKEIGSRGVEGVVVVQPQFVHQSKRGIRALQLADGDSAVEGHNRRGGDRKQLVIESDDLRPVGLLERRRVCMHSVDCGLELIWTGSVVAEA